jgi:hypothetical protein
LWSLVANPRPPYARFMLTTILAYVIVALASQRSWLPLGASFMLAISG